MLARPTPVAAVQTRAHDRAGFDECWPGLLARIAAAAEAGARLVVVPEGTVPAYVIGTEPVDTRLLERAAEDVIAVSARTGATIVYGGARAHEGGLANSAYVVTPAGIAGFADKCFLWHFDRRWFTEGDTLAPVTTPAGRLGVFICADGRLPTIPAALAAAGAEILVVPTAWVTSGRDPQARENIQADLMIPVRARENGLPIVAANKCGVEGRSVAYCGKSQIVAADGTVLMLAPQDSETTITADVVIGARAAAAAGAVRRGAGAALPARARVAIATAAEPALRAQAAAADAAVMIERGGTAMADDIALADDAAVLDPRGLVAARLDGIRLFVWNATLGDAAWTARFARTRAAELRCYVVVFDEGRAFAVDPDGTIVCGTFEDFAVAAFVFERARTDAWEVAPGTDVRAGLQRVAAFAGVTA